MRCLALLTLTLLLLACAGDRTRAPVEDRNVRRITPVQHPATPEAQLKPPPVSKAPERKYTVVGGDTMYSIAWRYGFDFRALARANGIAKPYTIYPGQTLKLTDEAPPAPAPTTASTKKPPKSASSPPATVAKKPVAAPVTKSSSATVKTVAPRPKSAAPVASGPIRWRWPTEGKVVRNFSGTVHKGIDIDGRAGDKVLAVADGRVVYAGSGIVGYGNLLIVKHNDIYLSAYGHNRRLMVAEGETVRSGQKIAEKGSSATNSVKLHFEIRREGKPIDPKKLLPRR